MEPRVDSLVRLLQPIPDLGLQPGDIGTVRSMWCAPATIFEVEFSCRGSSCDVRTLVNALQIESVEQRDSDLTVATSLDNPLS